MTREMGEKHNKMLRHHVADILKKEGFLALFTFPALRKYNFRLSARLNIAFGESRLRFQLFISGMVTISY